MKFRDTSPGDESVDPCDAPRLQRDSTRVAHLRRSVDGRVAPPVSLRTHPLSPPKFGDRSVDGLLGVKDLIFILHDSRRSLEGDAGPRVAENVGAEKGEFPFDGCDVELHRKDDAAQIDVHAAES